MDIEDEEHEMGAGRANTSKVFPREMSRRDLEDNNTKGLLSPKPKYNNSIITDSETIGWLEKVLMGEQLFDAFPQTTYVCILMDLLAYEHTELNNKAFELLMKFFNQRHILLHLLKQVQLLEKPESIKVLKKVTKVNGELTTFIELINQWVDEENQSSKNIIDIATELIHCKEGVDYLASILVEKHFRDRKGILEEIPGTGRSVEESLVVGLNGRIMKRNEISDKELKPNTENQRLVRNLNIPSVVIQILKISLSESQKLNEDYQDLIRSIYLFLIRFCTEDVANQNMVGEHLDFFLKELDFCPLVIFLIKEIFKNNKGFLAAKKDSVVRYISQKEKKLSVGSTEKHHYLMILKTLSKNHNRASTASPNEILNLISSVDEATMECFFDSQDDVNKAHKLVSGFQKAVIDHSWENQGKEEVKNEVAETRSQNLYGYFKIIYEYLTQSAFFLPFKKTVVEYLYHTLKSRKNDLIDADSCKDLLWRITEELVNDCEDKLNADDISDEVVRYGAPLNETYKSLSDKYIFKNVYLVLSCILKLNLEFMNREVTLQRIATVSCKLYYKIEEEMEYRKWIFDVIRTFYNNQELADYLEDLRHPLEDDDYLGMNSNREIKDKFVRKLSQKRNTYKSNAFGMDKAALFYQKMTKLNDNDELNRLLDKEFEKLVDWFSKFSDK